MGKKAKKLNFFLKFLQRLPDSYFNRKLTNLSSVSTISGALGKLFLRWESPPPPVSGGPRGPPLPSQGCWKIKWDIAWKAPAWPSGHTEGADSFPSHWVEKEILFALQPDDSCVRKRSSEKQNPQDAYGSAGLAVRRPAKSRTRKSWCFPLSQKAGGKPPVSQQRASPAGGIPSVSREG